MNNISANYDLVTFDVYMALMDIGGTLAPKVANEFGISTDTASAFVTLWRTKQMERAASSNAMALDHVCGVSSTPGPKQTVSSLR